MDRVRMVMVVRAGVAMMTVVSNVDIAAMVAVVGPSTCPLYYLSLFIDEQPRLRRRSSVGDDDR